MKGEERRGGNICEIVRLRILEDNEGSAPFDFRWWVLGTLGRFCIDSSLPFTVQSDATSCGDFRFEFLVLRAGVAATAWPSDTPLDPSDGLEDELRRCCVLYDKVCAAATRGAMQATLFTTGSGCTVKAALRKDEWNIMCCM